MEPGVTIKPLIGASGMATKAALTAAFSAVKLWKELLPTAGQIRHKRQ